MPLSHIIYASRPFGFDQAMLNGILADARRHNPRIGVTGALICRADLYLQLLEGEEAALETLYRGIAGDDRHDEVTRLVSGRIEKRLFPAWSMRDDPARSWMWTEKEVAAGAIERANSSDIVAIFERLVDEIEREPQQ
jgi:hypothetical protein